RQSPGRTVSPRPGDELQLRLLRAPRVGGPGECDGRTARACPVPPIRETARRSLAHRALARDGPDIADERSAWVRTAAAGSRRLLLAVRTVADASGSDRAIALVVEPLVAGGNGPRRRSLLLSFRSLLGADWFDA